MPNVSEARRKSARPATESSVAGPRYASALSQSSQVRRTRARIRDAARRVFGQKGAAASINDIVEAAAISRPSFYNYYATIDELFESITSDMVADLNRQIDRSFADIPDPATRIAIGIQHYCKRAYEDPDWANFLLHFGLLHPGILHQTRNSLLRDIESGVGSGRFPIREDLVESAFGMIVGGTLAAIMSVRMGIIGHLQIGHQTAEAALRLLGLRAKEAQALGQVVMTELRS